MMAGIPDSTPFHPGYVGFIVKDARRDMTIPAQAEIQCMGNALAACFQRLFSGID